MKLVPITPDSKVSDEVGSDDGTIQDVIDGMIKLYSVSGFNPPWVGYLAYWDGECVGTCAFKSSPHANRVEIAYFTFPKCEGRGIASRMAEMLLAIAHETSPSLSVIAQTLPTASASTRILEKLGFTKTRDFAHPEDGLVWEWERRNMPEQGGRGQLATRFNSQSLS
jgi:ribosomal-protein-alanine N-acetyltransferase